MHEAEGRREEAARGGWRPGGELAYAGQMSLPRAAAVASLLCVSLAACKRKPPPGPPRPIDLGAPVATAPSTAPDARFEERPVLGTRLVLDGHPDWACTLSYGVDGDVTCTATGGTDWPDGTTLALGAAKAPIENGGSAKLEKPYAIYGDLPLPTAGDAGALSGLEDVEIAPRGTLTIRFSNGVESKAQLPKGKVLGSVAEKVMKDAAEHPLAFDGEAAHAGPHTIYYLHPTQGSTALGPGKTLADVDWIALATSSVAAVDGVTCAFNTGSRYPLEKETETVKLVDRRTGASIDTKTFEPAKIGCPAVAFAGRAIVGPGRDAVFAWIRGAAKAHP